jgi:mannose-1-phosphate guanylyltransferase/mannose-6-phosphate isomerase
MYSLILAGGIGTRLWPLSRKSYPKQFLKLFSDKPLIQETLDRVKGIDNNKIIIVTNKEYKFLVEQTLNEYNEQYEIIIEPFNRSTLPAITLGINYIKEKYKINENEVIAVFPSDHYINPLNRFINTISEAHELAEQGYIVTLGIKPTTIEPNYGYIEVGEKIKNNCYLINTFHEKPSYEKAKDYIRSGKYCWNSGIYFLPLHTFEAELQKHESKIFDFYHLDYKKLYEKFHLLPEISIDYAIMEKTGLGATVISDIIWSDLGTWDSLFEILKKDKNGNVVFGDVLANNVSDSLIFNKEKGKFIVNVNCADLIIVNTDDVLLVSRKNSNQILKKVYNYVNQKRKELAIYQQETFRPWGSYKILEEDKNFKVKRIEVNSKAQLSLQLHEHRCEHWIIVEGEGEVVIDDKVIQVKSNDKLFIPKGSKHRIKNNGLHPLVFIEVQYGDNLAEEDIIRFEDIYGRI